MKSNFGRKEAGVVVACAYPSDRNGNKVVAFETRGGGMNLLISHKSRGKQRKRWPLVVEQRQVGNRWMVRIRINPKETALLKITLDTFTKEQAAIIRKNNMAKIIRQQEQEGVMWLGDIGKNQAE